MTDRQVVAALVWPVAAAYVVALTVFAAVLIVLGYVLAVLPGLPETVERSYARGLVWLLDTLLRPFDGYSRMEPRAGR